VVVVAAAEELLAVVVVVVVVVEVVEVKPLHARLLAVDVQQTGASVLLLL